MANKKKQKGHTYIKKMKVDWPHTEEGNHKYNTPCSRIESSRS